MMIDASHSRFCRDLMHYRRHFFAALLLMLVPIVHAQEQEQSKLTFAPPAVVVTPPVADVGVARTITVQGEWPNECVPTFVWLDEGLVPSLDILIARPLRIQFNEPCAPVRTNYRLEVVYTPKTAKTLKVFASARETGTRGPARLVVGPPAISRSAYNLTGLWYDPFTNGSGLTFVHNRDGTDAVFGTWYVYDNEGKPRWYTIQSTSWTDSGRVLEGKLYETASRPCSINVPSCPVVLSSAQPIGTVRLAFESLFLGLGLGPAAKIEAFTNNGVLLFSSTLVNLLL